MVRDPSVAVAAGLLAVAAVGWWWSVHSSGSMTMHHKSGMGMDSMGGLSSVSMTFGGFMVAWVAMMAAMMYPAIRPAVKLFGRASSAGRAVATPVFVAGYTLVWVAVGLPVYFAWRALAGPLGDGDRWVAYLAGGTFLAAALYQASPLKLACLRHCRSPLSFFLRQRYDLKRPTGAVRAGISHGAICLACCWAEMAVLVVLGTMNIGWMLAVAALIFVEKTSRFGLQAAYVASVVLTGFGLALIVHPHLLVHIT